MLRKIVSALTSAAMVAMFAPAVAIPSNAWAAEGVVKITEDTTYWTSGLYIAEGAVTLKDRAYLNRHVSVTLRLMDNCELRVSNIYIPEGTTLRIETEPRSTSTGKLIVESNRDGDAAIGSPRTNGNNKGNLIIYGGDITATSIGGGAGIGSGYEAEFGNITIKGGIVKATGSSGGAGIGAGIGGSSTSTKSTCGKIASEKLV